MLRDLTMKFSGALLPFVEDWWRKNQKPNWILLFYFSFQAAEVGVKRRTSSENNEPGEKKSKVRQSTMDDIFNTLKAQGKSELTVNKPSRIHIQ